MEPGLHPWNLYSFPLPAPESHFFFSCHLILRPDIKIHLPQRLMVQPVIPATQEHESGRCRVQGQSRKFSKTLSQNLKRKRGSGNVAPHGVLAQRMQGPNSVPSTFLGFKGFAHQDELYRNIFLHPRKWTLKIGFTGLADFMHELSCARLFLEFARRSTGTTGDECSVN